MNQFISLLFILSLMLSCETKEYKKLSSDNSGLSNFKGEFSASTTFKGLNSISYYDDSTATLNWSYNDDAVEYYIYEVKNSSVILIDKILGSATDYQVRNLESDRDYTFRVNLKNNIGLLDGNQTDFTITTHSVPSSIYYFQFSGSTKKNDLDSTPLFIVYGANSGDIVNLYSDASCSTKVASKTATSSGYTNIESSKLSVGSYTFSVDRENINGLKSICSLVTIDYNLLSCPDGYISVPSDASTNTKAFCVMKYEAKAWYDLNGDNLISANEVDLDGCNEGSCTTKNWGTAVYKPGSHSTGYPWRNLNIEYAKSACRGLGDNFDLISNSEWMIIATNIENVGQNWSNGNVGDGCLYRGNNGLADSCGYSLSSIDEGSARDTKAYHTLSNNEVIFDLAGNVSEWVDWGKDSAVTLAPKICSDTWTEFSSEFCDSKMISSLYRPNNPSNILESTYNSDMGLGRVEGGFGGVALRGGDFSYDENAGVFGLSLTSNVNSARPSTGFRCVYRP